MFQGYITSLQLIVRFPVPHWNLYAFASHVPRGPARKATAEMDETMDRHDQGHQELCAHWSL